MATEGERQPEAKAEAVDVRLKINRFNATTVPADARAQITPLVREAVIAAGPQSPDEATELMSRTTALAVFCHGQGMELLPEFVFAPQTIDHFISVGCAHLAAGTQINYRRILRRLGAAVLGPPTYPERALSLAKSPPVEPYSQQNVHALVAWSRGLPTERWRQGVTAILGLGLGAGLPSREMTSATASWIHDTPTGLVVVVHGKRARRVPVVAEWESALREAISAAGDSFLLLPQRSAARLKDVSNFCENLPRHDAPKLSPQRLRATWIVRHLDACVPLNVLADAAGVTTEQLCIYGAAMSPVAAGAAERFLRGDRR